MHHKRKRTKNRRAGCLLCKPHKGNGMKGLSENETVQAKKSREDAREQLAQLDRSQGRNRDRSDGVYTLRAGDGVFRRRASTRELR